MKFYSTVPRIISYFNLVLSQPEVLPLGEVAKIETQNFNFVLKFNRRITVDFSNKSAILPN